MKFGPVSVEDALGAVLAHSVGLDGKSRMRKGKVLDREDLQALQRAGVTQVTVARLAETDIDEDGAARALAQALVPPSVAEFVEQTKAFTGRVNLLAKGPGVAVLDVAALEAVNRVHPMITVATVPPFHQMADRGMIATIKIISYAVPSDALTKACALARDAISLAPPKLRSVRLIVSEIKGGAGTKGWEAIADRVAAFGLILDAPVVVPHDIGALCAELKNSTADLTLILTGSATSDIDDVAPSAIVAAGGVIERFGMPVDPGNLLVLGRIGQFPVIGLPGCARAPALNGADWVLARILCGLDVRSDDIAGMGVGGLLKEIPSRPQPRRGRTGKA